MKRKSFTLLELILTIVIVGIISVPAIMLIIQQLQSSAIAKETVTSTQILRQVVEELMAVDYDDLNWLRVYDNYGGSRYRVFWWVHLADPPGDDLKYVDVYVIDQDVVNIRSYIRIYRTRYFDE